MAKKDPAAKSSKKERAAARAAARDTETTAAISRADARAAAAAAPVAKPTPDPKKTGVKGLATLNGDAARNPGTGKVPSPHKSVAEPSPRNDLPSVRSLREGARAARDRMRKIKPVRVIALARGYYDNKLWEEGQKFDMKIDPELEAPRWVALVEGRNKQTPEEEFGPDADDTHDEDKDEDEDEGDDEDDDEDP